MRLLLALSGIGVTALVYALSRVVGKRYPSPLTSPVFFSTPLVIAVVLLSGMHLSDYRPAKDIIVSLLGPATVALAVPLYKNRQTLLGNLFSASLGLALGSLSTLVIAALVARLFDLPQVIRASVSIKSVTAPVAIELAPMVNGDSTLAAAFVIATGIIGAMLGPWLMDKTGIRAPLARGLALGTISHGQGTAQAVIEGEVQGAAAGVAMVLAAILASFVAPILVPILLR
ncbi:MAG TPA: LrgB family protein [Candidatus Acidoferrum sp.]|nr:LrgB family protein [Candidatus Acidoferrum sp.]